MAKRDEPGLIVYSFGYTGQGARGLLNPRVLLLSLAVLVLTMILLVAVVDRAPASLKVSVSHTAASRQLNDGQQGTFFNAWVNNRSQSPATYRLIARRSDNGSLLTLKGPSQAELQPGENRRFDVVLLTPADETLTIEFALIDDGGLELSVAEAYIGAFQER
jgi:hypothetical protein